MTCCRCRSTRRDPAATAIGWMVAVALVAGAVHPMLGVVAVMVSAMLAAAGTTHRHDERNPR